MPEPIQPSADTPPAAPPTTPPASTEVDLSTLSGEQLNKVLENKELWKNPRLQSLLDSDKQLKQLQKDQETERDKSLTEQKKFEELANKRAADLEASTQQIQKLRTDQALTNVLVKENVVDLDGALKLVDRSTISVDDNGVVSGVEEALTGLKTDKAYLFNSPNGAPNVGNPSNPSAPANPGTGRYKYKESQLTPAFYEANKKDILEANRLGLIEPDGPPQQ